MCHWTITAMMVKMMSNGTSGLAPLVGAAVAHSQARELATRLLATRLLATRLLAVPLLAACLLAARLLAARELANFRL
jgi:hypothetical protein